MLENLKYSYAGCDEKVFKALLHSLISFLMVNGIYDLYMCFTASSKPRLCDSIEGMFGSPITGGFKDQVLDHHFTKILSKRINNPYPFIHLIQKWEDWVCSKHLME